MTLKRRDPYEVRYGNQKQVIVPATYQSSEGPAADVRSLEVRLSDRTRLASDVPRDANGVPTPYRIELSLDCNAEFARRLADFFGMNGQARAWNERSPDIKCLPPAPAGAPALSDGVLEGVLEPDHDLCARCGEPLPRHSDPESPCAGFKR